MGTGVLALTLLFITVNALPSLKVQRGIYETFQKTYGRTFASEAEKELRFDIFSKRLQTIEELNKLHKADNVTFGITKFTDWTDAERARYVSRTPALKSERLPVKYVNKPALPTSFDWRSNNGVTSVKNQGDCGSCWSFATTAVVESQQLIKLKQSLDLSEQQVIDCDTKSKGCDGGWYDSALIFISSRGQLKESEDPYTATDKHACPSKAGAAKITDVWEIGNEPDNIASYLVDYGPLAVYYGVPKNFFDYVSGVYSPTTAQCADSAVSGYHAVTLVGFGVEGTKKYWIVKNSWGATWGEKGYFKFIRGTNACLMEDFPVGATL